ncbi:OmpA family protein [Abyssalbus ytuae]|uniref:OmpA family protein n=1 Tax=Abyssalbus ytuae TaxID=2926907 RepID=A0A9E7D261_9FLAO|nr:OmpA family protein [Abyssalbus ytuae]UOB16359.1 OmpA family protein [Abyssalbus ytuae]
MKKIITILTLTLSITGSAQLKKEIEKADNYFKRAFYSEAIPLYQEISKKDRSYEVLKNLGDSYYYTKNMGNAARVYNYIVKNYPDKVDDEYYFKYAHTLKAIDDYEEADKVIAQYYEKKDDQLKLKEFEVTKKYLENVRAIENRYTIANLGINTENSEFGAVKFRDKLVFSATKKETTLLDKLYKWDNQYYLDLYEAPLENLYSNDSVAYPLPGKINAKLHEAMATFTKDGNTIYFTRNNYAKGKRNKDNNEITHLQICKAQLVEGEWKNITPLPFNNEDYSAEHPALSDDEKTLYFASDMPGGYGSFDIYTVSINNDGSFGTPKNLGEKINTSGKEQFPFASADNKLYFSSDGHPGFGMLDIFVASVTPAGLSKPDNVGLPVNSGYDDFSFYIDADTKEGFFSSNRPGGQGSDDIYQIVETKPLIIEDCMQFISGTITDEKTNKPVPFASLALSSDKKNTIEKITADANGKFGFDVQCETTYTVIANKEGYTENQKTLYLKKERNKNNDASMPLKSMEQVEIEKARALEEQKAREEAARKKEQEKRANEAIAKENDIIKDRNRVVVKTDEINFDYDLWYLRRDSRKVLDKVITLMKKYPEMIIEIGTHTDIRGDEKYNLELSEKRATSVRTYFIENGIEPERISGVGYGETQPILHCETEESCTEEQHEINRRCEFVIKGF